ncbi:MAG: Gfo/Idh/MocA family oxidoreductase [Verrucomicrobiota bacterium]
MKTLSRRKFLQTAALTGGSLPLFHVGAAGQFSKSKLNIGLIGAGGIAKTAFGDCKNENVIAIAEVDDVTGQIGYEAFPQAKRYRDFRRMFDAHDKELDLVIVSTPDHTHFVATYAAMERGIAVQTQKPLTHNLWQARTLAKAAEKFPVQTVMGNQGHNFDGMRKIREWYEAGLLGTVTEVHAWTNRTTRNNQNVGVTFPPQTIPSTLDWDLWLGPGPVVDYHETFCPKNWRWHWDFGSGGLGDIGCHTLEIPYYAMGLGYPTSVYMAPELDFSQEAGLKKPGKNSATYVYEFPATAARPAVKVFWYEGGRLPRLPEQDLGNGAKRPLAPNKEGGCLMIGDKNTLYSPGMRPTSPRILNNWRELQNNLPPQTVPRAIGNPVKEIIAAVKGDIQECGSKFAYSGPLTEVVLLGTLANRFQTTVEFDPQSMTFSDSRLNEFVKGPVRSGWEYGEGLI